MGQIRLLIGPKHWLGYGAEGCAPYLSFSVLPALTVCVLSYSNVMITVRSPSYRIPDPAAVQAFTVTKEMYVSDREL